ncbi:HNH endonuclease [Methanobacterium sp.]|uniref:HNH endonuclease n=1 Tax=Methanobacterium sp. TaxID=2164 RepID=UPI003C7545BD
MRTMDTSYLEDLHFELKNRKYKILDELWELTQKHLDEHLGGITKSNEELDLLKAIENTDEFKSLLEDLSCVKASLNELYITFLDNTPDSELKKDKIIALKQKWGEEITTEEITRAVNCSKGYARQFYLLDGKVIQKDSRNGISAKTKRDVLKRDHNSCVVCESPENLEIHHIIPVMGSTIKDQDEAPNLALLCKECHYLAHSSNIMYRYMTKIIRDNIHHKPLEYYEKHSKTKKNTK